MNEPGQSIETQKDARACIYSCLAADDIAQAAAELVGDIETQTDPNILKVAEFALLKAPITSGMTQYLEDPFRYVVGEENPDPHELYKNVGEKTATFARAAFNESPDRELAEQVNQRRVEVLREQGRKSITGITGVYRKLGEAARSAAVTTYAAALVNAFDIQNSGKHTGDRDSFITAVKQSGELPRGLTRIHLNHAATAHRIMLHHGMAIQQGDKSKSINSNMLKVGDEGVAHLETPIRDWAFPLGRMMIGNQEGALILGKLGERPVNDVTIGCLLSFEPSLTTSYYHDYVDLMEQYGAWPEELS